MTSAVMITGAARGLGRALAFSFARGGRYVVLHGRDKESIAEVAISLGSVCMAVHGDLRDKATIDKLGTCAELHEIDVLINNAGQYLNASLIETSPEDIREILESNLIAPMLLTRRVVPMMERIGGGTIVNINSLAAVAPSAGETAYAASKGGLRAFGEALSRETAAKHIQVLNVTLGAMDTAIQFGRTDPGKCINPEEAADAVFDLVMRQRRTMRVTELEILRARY